MPNFNVSKSKTVIFLATISLVAFSVFFHTITAAGPTGAPPVGAGSFMDGNLKNGEMISIGGLIDETSPSIFSSLLIYSTPYPSVPLNYGINVRDKDGYDLFRVATSGIVVIGTTTLSNNLLYPLQAKSLRADIYKSPYADAPLIAYGDSNSGQCAQENIWECGYGIDVSSATISSYLVGNYYNDPTFYDAKISGFSSISAVSLIFYDTKNASSIAAGTFYGGNYAFPNSLGVSTSSTSTLPFNLSVYGAGLTPSGYFSTSTYLKIDPTAISNPGMLNVTSSRGSWFSNFNKGIRLEGNSSVEFGGGTNGTLYGISASSSRLYIFNTNTELNSNLSPNFYNLTISTSSVGVGIGQNNPSSHLHVSGTLRISDGDGSGFRLGVTSTDGFILTSDANGIGTWAQPAVGISNPGQDYTVRHNGSGWFGDSLLTNNGSMIGVGTTNYPTGTLLRVGSGGYFQFDKISIGPPENGECDNSSEVGRIVVSTFNKIYICTSASGWKSADVWHDPSYSNRKKITIDRSKIATGANLSNFPVMIKASTTDAMQDDCDDIKFYLDYGTTKLNHQIEKDSTESTVCAPNNTIVAWVQASLDYSATTTLYMYYGSSTASNQQNPAAVWDSNFKAVWHLQEFSTNGSNITNKYQDSTSNGILANQVKGDDMSTPFYRGVQLGESATTTDYISRANSVLLDGNDVTVSGWIKFNSLLGASTTPKGIIARDNSNDAYNILFDDINNKVSFYVRKGTNWYSVSSTASIVTTGQWYYLVLTHTANTLKGYINGQLIGSNTNNTAITRNLSNHVIGRYGGANYHWLEVDEVRYSDKERTQDWITTEYNNQSSPQTFYTIGAEE